jgi:hypothetical protein
MVLTKSKLFISKNENRVMQASGSRWPINIKAKEHRRETIFKLFIVDKNEIDLYKMADSTSHQNIEFS